MCVVQLIHQHKNWTWSESDAIKSCLWSVFCSLYLSLQSMAGLSVMWVSAVCRSVSISLCLLFCLSLCVSLFLSLSLCCWSLCCWSSYAYICSLPQWDLLLHVDWRGWQQEIWVLQAPAGKPLLSSLFAAPCSHPAEPCLLWQTLFIWTTDTVFLWGHWHIASPTKVAAGEKGYKWKNPTLIKTEYRMKIYEK